MRQFPRNLFLFLLLSISSLCSEEILWLTWQNDPTTTMVVHWLTSDKDQDDHLEFKKYKDEEWMLVEGSHQSIPEGNPYYIHALELNQLQPDTLYTIRKNSRIFNFRTAPLDLTLDVKFVDGGDIYHDTIEQVEKMNRIVIDKDPLFVIVGGDLAYCCSRLAQYNEKFNRWVTWLSSWSKTMVTTDGRMIPMIPVIGNHEVLGRGLQKPREAKMFYLLFSLPYEAGFRTIDFGDWLSLFLLDSDHTHAVSGYQADWLKKSLHLRQNVPYKFASYHVPAYPMHRQFDGKISKAIRKHWSPSFEKYDLTAAFEHHDHGFKRSQLIRNGKIDPTGILYLGDGAWGVDKPRSPKPRWYLASAYALRHVFLVTLSKGESKFEAFGEDNKVFDATVRKNQRGWTERVDPGLLFENSRHQLAPL